MTANKWEGGREGGRDNESPKKTASNGANRQTDGHGDSRTESAQ